MKARVARVAAGWYMISLGVATIAIALIVPVQPKGCHATQPVYSSSYQRIGTWEVTLPAGQSVTLPDGDTATCTAHGLDVR